MIIDWTQPVETTEDPPRPVRVLATDIENDTFPVVIAVGNRVSLASRDGGVIAQPCFPALRNVPLPKPEPVLREVWLELYANGETGLPLFYRPTRETMCVETRHIVWNSDGSPVEDEESISHWKSRVGEEAIRAEKWFEEARDVTRERDHWKAKAEALQAEVDRLRPVVDAAVAWFAHTAYHEGYQKHVFDLQKAVRAYQSKQAPAEPVKKCTTCRHYVGNKVYDGCELTSQIARDCKEFSFTRWEPRHD